MGYECSPSDEFYMAKALALAKRGLYTTDPNPRVGCVIVRDGKIVGEGWHRAAGQAHAEIEALRTAGDRAQGAVAYVTLEPCCHHGKTPPCSDALIKAGVSRVVAAMQDPNPLVAGQGMKTISDAGIDTTIGLLKADAESLNRGFCYRMRHGKPLVVSKLAMSLDGRTAMASGESKWITGDNARRDVHRMRARSSAIMTGIGTVLADNPSLTVRLGDEMDEISRPLRVILDSALRTPPESTMARMSGKSLILTANDDSKLIGELETSGFEIKVLPSGDDARMDLCACIEYLSEFELNEILVEAGPVLNGALLQAGLVDELVVYMSPCVLGDKGRGLFHLPGLNRISDRKVLHLIDTRQVGNDIRLRFSTVNSGI